MVYVATTGGERGPAKGLLAAAAVVLGGVCYTVTTAIGLSAAMAAYPALFVVVRGAGVLYLVYLGIKQINRARDTSPVAASRDAQGKIFRTGLIISLSNIQLATFFLAFLPQFIVADGGPVWLQFLTLGLAFNCCSFLVQGTIGTVTGFAGQANLGGVRFRQVMRVVAGLAFIGVAVKSGVALLK